MAKSHAGDAHSSGTLTLDTPAPTGDPAEIQLRDYQREAIEAIRGAWDRGMLRPAVQLSTGLGKTIIFCALIADHLDEHGGRAIVIVHREELAEQTRDKLARVAPHLKVGICKAERDEIDGDVIVASVQTLAVPGRKERIQDVTLIVCDEAHRAAARTWRDALTHFGAYTHTRTVGLSATLARSDGTGLNIVWDEVVYERGTLWAIRERYLTDIRGHRIGLDALNLAAVQTRGGDYVESQLAGAMMEAGAPQLIAAGYAKHAGTRKGISFAPSVAMAAEIADALNEIGITAETISGTTTRGERTAIYERFKTGETRVLSSCLVLCEGFDEPTAEVAVIARPTKSQPLFIQMAGRVLRRDPDNPNKEALLLDVSGAAGDHDLSACLPDLIGTEENKRPIEPEEGESLVEALERAETEAAAPAPTRSHEIDLFGGSRQNWLQTTTATGSRWFLPAGDDQYIYVLPNTGGTWIAGVLSRTERRLISAAQPDITRVMTEAETYASQRAGSLAKRTSRWRAKPVSDKQRSFARRIGATLPTGTVTSGQASDAIAIIQASRMLAKAGAV